MVSWTTEPANTQTLAAYTASIKDRDERLAKMDFAGDTNVLTDTIRWNATGNKFEKWNGSAWVDLTSQYTIDVATLGGIASSGFALIAHVGAGGSAHVDATTSVSGFISGSDKTKLNGIATAAEVNQNAFSNIAVSGQSTLVADSKIDTLTFVGGTNIVITTAAGSDQATWAISGTLSPSNLPTATVSAIGAVELATNAEADTGTDTTRAVTPSGLEESRKRIRDERVTAVTGTITSTDAGKRVKVTAAGATTQTINSGFTNLDIVRVLQHGAGQITFAAGSGVTLRSPNGNLKVGTQYDVITIEALSSTELVLAGNLVA